jgi:hypothetical protein
MELHFVDLESRAGHGMGKQKVKMIQEQLSHTSFISFHFHFHFHSCWHCFAFYYFVLEFCLSFRPLLMFPFGAIHHLPLLFELEQLSYQFVLLS